MSNYNYRNKPVVIQAFKLGTDVPPDWWTQADNVEVSTTSATIKTLEGVMLAEAGDYVIRGVKGELYPCKADIFAATYEQAD